MKRKFILIAGAIVTASVTPAAAATTKLLFDFSGPSGTAVFKLAQNPKPAFASSFLGSDEFGFRNVAGLFGGIAGKANTISFGNGFFASLSIAAANLGFTQFTAPTLFSGPPQSPTFLTGTFTLINPFFGNASVTISPVVSNAVPEPTAWAMMLIGVGALGAGMRYRGRGVAGASV